jgi:hypothetical protein
MTGRWIMIPSRNKVYVAKRVMEWNRSPMKYQCVKIGTVKTTMSRKSETNGDNRLSHLDNNQHCSLHGNDSSHVTSHSRNLSGAMIQSSENFVFDSGLSWIDCPDIPWTIDKMVIAISKMVSMFPFFVEHVVWSFKEDFWHCRCTLNLQIFRLDDTFLKWSQWYCTKFSLDWIIAPDKFLEWDVTWLLSFPCKEQCWLLSKCDNRLSPLVSDFLDMVVFTVPILTHWYFIGDRFHSITLFATYTLFLLGIIIHLPVIYIHIVKPEHIDQSSYNHIFY